MKFFLFVGILCMFAGCGKITDLSSATGAETEQTGDPVYDSQTEMKLLVPWDIFV